MYMVRASDQKVVIVGDDACIWCASDVMSSKTELCIKCRMQMKYGSRWVGCLW